MTKPNDIPRRLYKYRKFNNDTLHLLIFDKTFYADPSTFNDPLDTRPSLKIDLDTIALEGILIQLIERRMSAEMHAAALTINYRGPKTVDHIKRYSRKHAKQLLSEIAYQAADPNYEFDDPHARLLGAHIETELFRQFDKGIVSLAEREDCPLMWSHYGEQHHGICLGYSVPKPRTADLYKVKYQGGRIVKASKVAKMLDGDHIAMRQVNEAVLLRKAANWGYEQEWRLIGNRGLQNSVLELEEIVFGMRCSDSVKFAVAKAMEPRRRQVNLYEVHEIVGKFGLKKRILDTDEMLATLPKRSLDIVDTFSRVKLPD